MIVPVRCFVFAAALLAPLPASAGLLVQIDKSAQRMTVSQDGQVLHTWPVSTGKRGYSTPSGSYKTFRLEKDHFSKEWDDAPMPNSIFFTKQGHAIHGTFEEKRLGTPASHGCVRLSRAHAETLFQMVKADGVLNTQVVLTGTEPAPSQNVPMARTPQNNNSARNAPANDSLDNQAYGSAQPYGGQRYGGQAYSGQTYSNDDRYPAPSTRYQQRAPTDDPRYAYEDVPQPAYRGQQPYGRPYYQQQQPPQPQPQPYYGSRYRDPYANPPPPPPGYQPRGYGYGWN
jgi:hypothetical protein